MSFYQPSKGPIVLCILDGWGYRTVRGNAVALARTPFDFLMKANRTASLVHQGLMLAYLTDRLAIPRLAT